MTLLIDGVAVASQTANEFRTDLRDSGVGEGYHGFRIPLARDHAGCRIAVSAEGSKTILPPGETIVPANGAAEMAGTRYSPVAVVALRKFAEQHEPVSSQPLAGTTVDSASRAGGRSSGPRYVTVLLRDVLLNPATGVMIVGDRLVLENQFCVHAGQFAIGLPRSGNHIQVDREAIADAKTVDEAIVFANAFHDNYFHWHNECLPGLWCAHQESKDCPIVVPAGLTDWQRDSLALSGLNTNLLAVADNWLRVAECRVTPILDVGRHQKLLPLPLPLREFARDAGRRADRRVYIRRGEDASRQIANSAEVEEILGKHDFQSLTPARLPYEEQIKLFGSTAAVFGVHGAGLTNMTFMPKASHVIEVMSTAYVNLCFESMAEGCGLTYRRIFGETQTHMAVPAAASPLTLDPAAVADLVAGLS